MSEPKGRDAEVSEPKGRDAEVSEPKGRGADWTEERGTSDEGRRHLKAPRRRANLDKEPGDVAAMFDAIAGRYDLLNDILSAGQVRLWRRAVARITGAGPGELVLDLAAGTGTSSLTFTATGADCVACDFSLGMLQAGHARLAGPGGVRGGGQPFPRGVRGDGSPREKEQGGSGGDRSPRGNISFAAGDALRLPFRDGAFDAVTISFGLRNVADPGAALAEMRRVTRPGGRLVVCEFSTITIAPVDMLYRRYLINVLPAIARRTARSPEAYEYLAESIADWPAQRELARMIEAAGWSAVRWHDLSMGVVAVHVARHR
jgi:demethylmenaquinone methyltransferase/2-methoxy-6-polyprenyl-1,4-benzoquinol methylase